MTCTELVMPEFRPRATPMPFDYSTLAADVADEMRARASRIHDIQQASVPDLGRELIAAKEQVEHGCFVAWVQTACQMNIRGAERAMQAAELVGKNDKLSYLPADGLLALASRSAPQSVVNEVLGEIAAGETPSAAGIKRRIAEAKKAEKRGRGTGAAETAELTPSEEQKEEVREVRELRDCERRQAEQAAATTELIAMLVAWDRFDEFIGLLKKAELSGVVEALRNHRDMRDSATVGHKQTPPLPELSGEAAAGDRDEAEVSPSPAEAVDETAPDDCVATPLALLDAESETPTHDYVDQTVQATPMAVGPELSAGVLAEELLRMFVTLKRNSRLYARQWVAGGCPDAVHPNEHFTITEKLAPFRATATQASEAQRQRFLQISAEQLA